MAVHYFCEDIDFRLAQAQAHSQWLTAAAAEEGYTLAQLNVVFCSDEHLLGMNRTYLNHDYYTDILTFDQGEEEGSLEGDVFISIDRVQDNAAQAGVPAEEELRRVMVHGVLHLCGWADKTEEEAQQMRQREAYYLRKFA